MRLPALVLACLTTMLSLPLRAQDEAGRDPSRHAPAQDPKYYQSTSPASSPRPKASTSPRRRSASLNISFYGVFRYMNQLPGDQTFTDHLGRERTVKARNDLNWHRTFVWLTGFFYDPKFRYNISLWSLPTTQQTLLFGNLQYRFNQAIGLGVGIAPNLTARSMQGSWPFWGSSDRQMAEDFFRGGFSSGVFVTGQPLREVLVHRLGQHQHQPARYHGRQRLRATWRTAPASSGGRRTGEFGPREWTGRLRVPQQAGHPIRRIGRPQPRIALRD